MKETSIPVEGLHGTVEILVDTWGVPHLYAENQHDVFLAQGYNAARERLFQIDLWRRKGLGRLSEAFGPAFAEQDRAARLFLYRGDMRAEWLAYGSDTKAVTTAFVEGINAFIRQCLVDHSQLPPEFPALGYLPELWDPKDIPRIRSHGLFHNVEQEVARALTLRDLGPEAEDLRRVRDPQVPLTVPDGLDLNVISDEILRVYRLATGSVVLGAPEAVPSADRSPEGSNNWVVGSSRTRSGRPLLANDPHRAVTLPALRYVSHLSAPGLDVIGGGEPVLPGISIGHNGHIAFGLTIFAIDQEDLYVYRTNPDNPLEYWYKGGWERMSVVCETVTAKGTDPIDVELRFTRHGPVIHEQAGTAFAVCAAWLEPGMAPYLGSMEYMKAKDAGEFNTAMNRWGAPGENQVYAEPGGTIGWRPGGLIPIRRNWDGLLPVPGDGRYEWDGFYDNDVLPLVNAPGADWVASANEFNLPDDFDEDVTVGYDWYAPYRAQRIDEVLTKARDWTVSDCLRLQADHMSLPSRVLAPIIADLGVASPLAAEARDLLLSWDGIETADSPAPAVFETWFRNHLRPALLDAALETVLDPALVADAVARLTPLELYSGDPRVTLAIVADPEKHLGTRGAKRLKVLAEASFAAAVEELERRLGPDVAAWRWGDLHFVLLEHPARSLLPPDFPGTVLGPLPRSGGGDTVASTAFNPDFRQASGASFRVVVDVGDWDASVFVNAPGQSGTPDSEHFADHFDHWDSPDAYPLLYSRSAVEAAAAERMWLVPPTSSGDA
jgi:penicillin amidase